MQEWYTLTSVINCSFWLSTVLLCAWAVEKERGQLSVLVGFHGLQ